MYTTYILFSAKLNKYYTGQTSNLARRLEEHNNGKTPFMAAGVPWVLVFSQTFATRSEAMHLEKNIKKRDAERFLQDNGGAVG